MQIHVKYRDRGVTFISLSSDPQPAVAAFVAKHHITWSCGYEVPRSVIASWGAINSGATTPGYESAPTLYLVGADGRIRWTDGRQRMMHEDNATIMKELESELAKAIEESKETFPKSPLSP